ncbi:hypothetical protein SVIOM342S_05292 [Streptomyces violaceorubidus]
MNRKTLVLPAVVGLLAPVLAACGRIGQRQRRPRDAIAVGTTDGFNVSKEITAPVDPAYAYDVRRLEHHAPDLADADGAAPR